MKEKELEERNDTIPLFDIVFWIGIAALVFLIIIIIFDYLWVMG
jgi:hypothetical protein